MKKIVVFSLLSLTLIFSCVKEKAQEPKPTTPVAEVSFSADVQPIFLASCAFSGCHSSASQANGMSYETHAGAFAVDNSKTLGSIKHTPGFKAMPQGGTQISQEKINIIESWIRLGKKND